MNINRVAFTVVYILVDIVYVMIARDTYMKVVHDIQKGATQFTSARVLAAIAAYSCMALGWWFLVAPVIEASGAGLLPGFVYGLTLYGVFNFTNYAMFDKYTPRILTQDLLWGISWVTVLSVAYGMYITKSKRGIIQSKKQTV